MQYKEASSGNTVLLLYVLACAFLWPLAIIFLLGMFAADRSLKWFTLGAPAVIIIAALLLIFVGLPIYAWVGIIFGVVGMLLYVMS
jgi:hypothetical protein